MLINLSFSNIVVRTMSVRVARTLMRYGRVVVPSEFFKVFVSKVDFAK